MSVNVSSVTNHFVTANKGFITTTSSTFTSGVAQTTVPLTSVSGLTNGSIFVGILAPGTASEREFTGTVDTAGSQITGVKWTDGSDATHTAGTTIVDYVSATGQNMLTKGLTVSLDQDGTLKAGAVDVTAVVADSIITRAKLASALSTEVTTGWLSGDLPAVSSVTYNGNRSYDITFASTVASILSSGMRLRTTRTVAAPTQCTSLNGTTQYYSKASPNKLTFTDDFVVSAWVKLSSYALGHIASRYNGTSGWQVYLTATGQVTIQGYNAGAGNNRYAQSYQSVPLNKWVHITAFLDMSGFTYTSDAGATNNYIMIDGVVVPGVMGQSGTNPTALIQAGDLNIGASNATQFFPGKIAQVAIFNARVTPTTMRTYMSQGLSGSETSLASAYSFNNSITDLNTTTPNDLTANGSAVATNADSPFGNAGTSSTLDYALVQAVNTTVATVQVPEGCTIPTSGGVTSVAYSVQGNPFGWVSDKGRWEVLSLHRTQQSQAAAVVSTWYNIGSAQLSIPTGSWSATYSAPILFSAAAVGAFTASTSLSSSSSSESDVTFSTSINGANYLQLSSVNTKTRPIVTTTQTTYYQITRFTQNTGGGAVGLFMLNDSAPLIMTATPANL